MAEATQAPWKVDDDKTSIYVWRGDGDEFVCGTYGVITGTSRETALANAHLIAAAPDLLAACKAAWASHCDSTGCDLSWIGMMQQAIIKAEANEEAVPE